MRELMVRELLDYLDDDCGPETTWTEDEFDRLTYSRWAASELVTAILDHPMEPVEDIIFDFALKMHACMVVAGEKVSGDLFCIAAEFASDCLENILQSF